MHNNANATPRVGPLVLNEIMYHPPDLGIDEDNVADEYIELCNITTIEVPLFDPSAATNTWRLRGGVNFNFPTGAQVGSCSWSASIRWLIRQRSPPSARNTPFP